MPRPTHASGRRVAPCRESSSAVAIAAALGHDEPARERVLVPGPAEERQEPDRARDDRDDDRGDARGGPSE